MTNLTKAFKVMRQMNLIANENFSCCSNCGHCEIQDVIATEVGYVFYHMQDNDRYKEGKDFGLSYGGRSNDDDAAIAVGYMAVAALRSCGVETDWDGNVSKKIMIKVSSIKKA